MRVTQLELNRNFLTDLEKLYRNFVDVNRQLSTGKKLNYLGDSPLGSADLVDITQQALRLDTYGSNMISSAYQLKASEAALNAVYNAFVDIHTLGSQAANEPTSAEGRGAILLEIEKLREELISRGNTQVDGIYIFAGTAVDSAAFELDASGHVVYRGNDDVNKIPIGDGVAVDAGVSGSNALGTVFEAIDKLIDALNNSISGGGGGEQIDEALSRFGSALDDLNKSRGEIGVNLSIVNRMSSMLETRNNVLREQRSNIEDANILEVTTRISQLQVAINAGLTSGSAILQQNTLFDIIG